MKREEKRYSVRFPPGVLESIQHAAQEDHRSVNGEIVQAVVEFVAKRKKGRSHAQGIQVSPLSD